MSITNYDKPFKTYPELIQLLESKHKLSIPNKDFALEALSTMSYYDLINGYKECFMDNNEHFRPDITLEYLFTFHCFDHDIKNILFKYSVYIEKIFKTKLAYLLSDRYGIAMNDYLDPSHYARPQGWRKAKRLQETLTTIKSIPSTRNLGQPTKHYRDSKNHIPPWILFKNVNFSTSIDLYSFLIKTDKDTLVSEMIASNVTDNSYKKELTINALYIVRKYRNIIAHNLKFVTNRIESENSINVSKINQFFSNTLIKNIDFKDKRGRNDPYAMILCIIILLNNKYLINDFITELILHVGKAVSDRYDESIFIDYCKITGLPEDILDRLLRFQKNLPILYK